MRKREGKREGGRGRRREKETPEFDVFDRRHELGGRPKRNAHSHQLFLGYVRQGSAIDLLLAQLVRVLGVARTCSFFMACSVELFVAIL